MGRVALWLIFILNMVALMSEVADVGICNVAHEALHANSGLSMHRQRPISAQPVLMVEQQPFVHRFDVVVGRRFEAGVGQVKRLVEQFFLNVVHVGIFHSLRQRRYPGFPSEFFVHVAIVCPLEA